jgi:hypothetical protein
MYEHRLEDTHILETMDPETLQPVLDGGRGLAKRVRDER